MIGTLGRVKEMIDKEYISLGLLEMLILDEADKFCSVNKWQ